MDDAAVLTNQKHLFSLPDGEHYLNCAYMSPTPKRVVEAGIRGIMRKTAPSGIHADDFFADNETVRQLFARLVGASAPERVAIIPAASYGVATVARNLTFAPGQNIVVADGQFPSNVYAWREAARRHGVELRTVMPPDRVPRGEAWTGRVVEAIDAETIVVAAAPLHWTDGTCFNLEAIGARARDCDAALVVDGTQAVGAMPFDVQQIRPDALVCAGYKWLLGPYSVGLAYFGPRFDGGIPLEEGWAARRGSEDFRRLIDYQDDYHPGALRYDVGERSNFILMPMLLAALEQVLAWDLDEVQAYCRSITAELFDAVRDLGFGVEDDDWRAGHLVGRHAPARVDLEAVKRELQARQVSVSLRGSAIRVSPHVYNDASDVAALLEVLRDHVSHAA
ncbi:MAG: aminotransferase class V-fold PLP-dependent enzyme [Dehalococcoidia bacterium]|nr:aminotransferase class V-fold PLP-dependent enzyme [Dehalococcoidia bacterium]